MKDYKNLTLDDRKTIEKMLHENATKKAISEEIGVCKTTVFRELKKCPEAYIAEDAHKLAYQSLNCIDWDIIGRRFGLLVVESYANKYNRRTWWKCKCDCGKYTIESRKKLTEYCSKRRQLSCGCIPKQWGGNKEKKLPHEESALRKYQDLLAFRKIDRDCWEWTGYMQKGKTPKTSWKNKAMSVRKCMYLIINGTTYEPNPVYAACGNLKCFNPDHLTLNRPSKKAYRED